MHGMVLFNAFQGATGEANKGRGVAVLKSVEREAASGRGDPSSNLLRCPACIHHLQNSLV